MQLILSVIKANMLPMSELEYTGIMQRLKLLNDRFSVRG
jgi:hypothetical protein